MLISQTRALKVLSYWNLNKYYRGILEIETLP